MGSVLAEAFRAKYPGAYDDVPDGTLEAAIAAKYPGAYDDLVSKEPQPSVDFATEGRTKRGKAEQAYYDSQAQRAEAAAEAKGSTPTNLYPAGRQDVTTQDIQNESASPRKSSPTRTVAAEQVAPDLVSAFENVKDKDKLGSATSGYLAEAPNVERPGDFLKAEPGAMIDKKTPGRVLDRQAGSATKVLYDAASFVTSSIDAAGNIVKSIVGAPQTTPEEGVTGWLNRQSDVSKQYVTGRDNKGEYVAGSSPVALTPEYRAAYPAAALASDVVDTLGSFGGQMLMSGGNPTGFGVIAGGEKLVEGQREYLRKHPEATPLEAYNAAAPSAMAKGYLFRMMGPVTSGAAPELSAVPLTRVSAMARLARNLGTKTAADTGYMLESQKVEGAIDKDMGVNPNYNPDDTNDKKNVLPTMAQAFLFSLVHTAGKFQSATKLADADDYTTLLNAYAAARGSFVGTPAYEADAATISNLLKQTGGRPKEMVQKGVAELRKMTADNVINDPESGSAPTPAGLLDNKSNGVATPHSEPPPTSHLDELRARLTAFKETPVTDTGIGDPNITVEQAIAATDTAVKNADKPIVSVMPTTGNYSNLSATGGDIAIPFGRAPSPTVEPVNSLAGVAPLQLRQGAPQEGITQDAMSDVQKQNEVDGLDVAVLGVPDQIQTGGVENPQIVGAAEQQTNLPMKGTTNDLSAVPEKAIEPQDLPPMRVQNEGSPATNKEGIVTPAPIEENASQVKSEPEVKYRHIEYNPVKEKWTSATVPAPASQAIAHIDTHVKALSHALRLMEKFKDDCKWSA